MEGACIIRIKDTRNANRRIAKAVSSKFTAYVNNKMYFFEASESVAYNTMDQRHLSQKQKMGGYDLPAKVVRRRSRGGGGAPRPPLFAPNSLKSPLNWKKIIEASPRTPCAPFLFKSWIRP